MKNRYCFVYFTFFAVVLMKAMALDPLTAQEEQDLSPTAIYEPKPEMGRPSAWDEPTEVQVLLYMLDIDEVDSAEQNFSASVYYEARWKNPLLRHKGPGFVHRRITEVWTPRLAIVSQQMAWKAFPEFVQIAPDGTVFFRQKIWGKFSQPLALQEFPIDKQTLSIHLVAAGLLEKDIKIIPLVEKDTGLSSGISEKFSLPDFDVLSWDSKPSTYFALEGEVGAAGYEMTIEIKRRSSYYVLKVILPLCLIVVMSWLARWIDPKQVGVNIGISTTAFLTLVAYLFAITILLPKVSYITRMDRFILLSTLLVFVGLLQTVGQSVMIKLNKEELAERIDWWSRPVYPLVLAAVVFFSFGF